MGICYNQTLTNYAFGLAQDKASALADFIAPRVTVGATTGNFKKFNEKLDFQVYSTARAVGGRANRIEFTATDGTFDCKPNALEAAIDDHERERAGAGVATMVDAKVATLVSNAMLAHEKAVFDLVASTLSDVSKSWNGQSSADPIADIDEQIASIAAATGIMPNRMVIGLPAWHIIKNHPNVVKRVSGLKTAVTEKDFAGVLLNPGIEIRVGVLSSDSYKIGKTASKSNLVGSNVFIFIGSDSPSQYDPGFAKTFTVNGTGLSGVRQYRDEGCRSDVYALDWSEDVQVISSTCAKQIVVS